MNRTYFCNYLQTDSLRPPQNLSITSGGVYVGLQRAYDNVQLLGSAGTFRLPLTSNWSCTIFHEVNMQYAVNLLNIVRVISLVRNTKQHYHCFAVGLDPLATPQLS